MYQQHLIRPNIALTILILAIVGLSTPHRQGNAQQTNCQTFTETNKTVCGTFLTYWKEHGGIAQQGYPLTNEFNEVSEINGKTYRVQYFERAVFEYHAENRPPYQVLLSLVGSVSYKQKYPAGAPAQTPNTTLGSTVFPQTGKRLGGKFLHYWRNHGGVMQQGFPISDEFQERSDLDGKTYTVQYFERAVFEWHPDNNPPYDILLSQLGALQFKRKYHDSEVGPPMTTPTPDVFASLRQRPLQLPTPAPGNSCITSRARGNLVPNSSVYVFGRGPVYLNRGGVSEPGIISVDGVIDLASVAHINGTYRIKAPWLGDPSYPGPILIRDHQVDGPNRVAFEYAQKTAPQEEMRLDESNNTGSASGWNFWPSGILLPGVGCYGLQIDGLDFTDVIILRAVDRP